MKNKSSDILNASSSLLGFTFVVLTAIKGLNIPHSGIVDEIVALCVVIFAFSCFLSFLSIRSKTVARSKIFELVADYVFLTGLTVIAISCVLLAFDFLTFV